MARFRLAAVAAAALIPAAVLATVAAVPAGAVTGYKFCEKNGRGDCADVNTISIGNPLKEHTQANSRNWYFHQTGTDDGFPQGYLETYNGYPVAAVNCTVGAGGGSIIVTTDTTQTGTVWDEFTDSQFGNSYLTNRYCSGGNGHWNRCMGWFNNLDSNLTIGDTLGNDGIFKALALH